MRKSKVPILLIIITVFLAVIVHSDKTFDLENPTPSDSIHSHQNAKWIINNKDMRCELATVIYEDYNYFYLNLDFDLKDADSISIDSLSFFMSYLDDQNKLSLPFKLEITSSKMSKSALSSASELSNLSEEMKHFSKGEGYLQYSIEIKLLESDVLKKTNTLFIEPIVFVHINNNLIKSSSELVFKKKRHYQIGLFS